MNVSLILFHGTDERMISLTEAERCAYLSDCKKVVDYLWNIYKPYYDTEEVVEVMRKGIKVSIPQRKIEQFKDYIIKHSDKALWYSLYEKLVMIEANHSGNQQYQYGALYLTGDKNKAIRYALSSFAGGEMGLIAYRLIQGSKILGWHNLIEQNDIREAIDKIKTFAEAEPKPVVLKIKNIGFNKLIRDNGKQIQVNDMELYKYFSYRYNGNYNLSLGDVEYVNLNDELDNEDDE